MRNSRFSKWAAPGAVLVIAGLVLGGRMAEAQGGRFVRTVDFSMTNLSNHTANVVHSEGGSFHVEQRVRSGETFRGTTGPNEVWGWADPDTQEIFRSSRISSLNRRLDLRESDVHIAPPAPVGFDMAVINRTNEALYVSREVPRAGMRRMTSFGTLKPQDDLMLPLDPGMKWLIEDSDGRTIKSGAGDPRVRSISIVPRDIPPREASTTLINYHNFLVRVLERHGNHNDEIAVIRPLHRVTVKGRPGATIIVEQASTGRILKTFTLSGTGGVMHLRGFVPPPPPPRRDSDDDDGDYDNDNDNDNDDDDRRFGRGRILRRIEIDID